MKKLNYYVVDVFTDEKFKGNQLAVVHIEQELTINQYYDISREFGYSETSFVHYADGSPLTVRSFTPANFEIIGAGHNLLGAVSLALIKQWDIFRGQDQETWVIMAGERISLKISYRNELPYIGMKQRPAEILGSVPVGIISEAIGLSPDNLILNNWNIHTVKTEVGHLMVPVKDGNLLRKAILNKRLLKETASQFGFEGCYLFTTNHSHPGFLAETRFFNPSIGIDEDPATGTAAGPLAGYLKHLGHIEPDVEYRILQGAFVNQPSIIGVKVLNNGIWVSGSSVLVMEGVLYKD